MKDKNINILETFFELIQLEVATMQQKIISRHWSFWKIIEKEPQKPRPKLKKKITENICSAYSPMQVVVFRKHVLIFIEQRLKFCHFEGSIIP